MAAHRKARGRHRARAGSPGATGRHTLDGVTVARLRRSVSVAALSVALTTPLTAHASTLISIGATGSWTDAPVNALKNWHQTHASDEPVTDTVVVDYPASLGFIGMPMGESVAQGTLALLAAIQSIDGKKIVVCESQGCLSATLLLQQFAADPTLAPAGGELIFVMVGNPATAGGGTSAQNPGVYHPFFRITFFGSTPDSPFQTVNVTREYDFFADRPLDSTNTLAVLNNLAAFLQVHPFYGDVDMNDPDNLVKVVGNTKFVLVPTERLPMLDSWYDAADTWLTLTGSSSLMEQVRALDARLREIIDQDYDRTGYVSQGTLQQDQGDQPGSADGGGDASAGEPVALQEDSGRPADSEDVASGTPNDVDPDALRTAQQDTGATEDQQAPGSAAESEPDAVSGDDGTTAETAQSEADTKAGSPAADTETDESEGHDSEEHDAEGHDSDDEKQNSDESGADEDSRADTDKDDSPGRTQPATTPATKKPQVSAPAAQKSADKGSARSETATDAA